MNVEQRMKLIRGLAVQADRFYEDAQRLGQLACQNDLEAHQMKSLERIADGALKVSDVLDCIKTRTGRQERWRHVGPDLVNLIRGRLAASRDELCRALDVSPEDVDAQQVYLHLIRTFVRQMVAQYEYAAAGGRLT